MQQYEIRRLKRGRSGDDLVLVLQSDFANVFGTVVVAPLARIEQVPAIARLRPRIRVGEEERVIVIDRLAAIDRSDIADLVDRADALRDEITRALDLLFTGF